MKSLAIAFLALALIGCKVASNVSAFSTLPLSGGLKSIYVEGAEDNLEYEAYKKIIERAFKEKDYVIAPDLNSADYLAVFAYSIGDGGDLETTKTTPWKIGNTLFFTSEKMSRSLYRRVLYLTISDTKKIETVYEGQVISTGKCGTMPQIMPYLVESLFEKFPRGSGKVTSHFVNVDC